MPPSVVMVKPVSSVELSVHMRRMVLELSGAALRSVGAAGPAPDRLVAQTGACGAGGSKTETPAELNERTRKHTLLPAARPPQMKLVALGPAFCNTKPLVTVKPFSSVELS